MEAVRKFLARKNIVFSAKRYFIDAMGAMAQGLFCIPAGGHHSQHPGPAAAHRIPDGCYRHPGQGRGRRDLHHRRPVLGHEWGRAWRWPSARRWRPLLWCCFPWLPWACAMLTSLGGAGGPLAVLFVAIIASRDAARRCQQGDEGRHPGHAHCHHPRRHRHSPP